MNLDWCINRIFPYDIVVIDKTLLPEGFYGDHEEAKFIKTQVAGVLDELGRLSAAAQRLKTSVTSATSMKESDHRVYILKDGCANSNSGAILGFLKIGRKKLYVYDHTQSLHVVMPLCVLDFYVVESEQRRGIGKRIFDYMLKKENIDPGFLAIDRPSDICNHFLRKNYGLHNPIRQANHFVVYDAFFKQRG